MKTVSFDSIRMFNFRSYRDKHVLELSSYGIGLHCLRGVNKLEPRLGSNGSGKSGVWDALTWCLYGRTVNGLRNVDVLSWGTRKCSVTIRTTIDNERKIIRRTINPNLLTVNKKESSQESVVKLIGLDFDAFCHSIILGQSRPLFFDLAPAQKMDLLSEVLDLSRWERRSSYASERVKNFKSDLDTQEGRLTELSASLVSLSAMLVEAEERSAAWDQERAENLEAKQLELNAAEKRLAKCETALKVAAEKKMKADSGLKDFEDKERELLEVQSKCQKHFDLHNLEYQKLVHAVARLESQIEKAKTSNKCPTCGQRIKSEFGIEALKRELSEANEDRKKAKDNTKKAADELQDAKSHALEARRQLEWKRESVKGNEQNDALRDLSLAQSDKKMLERSVAEYKNKENPHKENLESVRKRKRLATSDKKECSDLIEKIKRRIDRYSFWSKGFKEIRTYIIDDALQELEIATNAVLPDLGLIGWSVTCKPERESDSGSSRRMLNVEVTSPSNSKRVKWQAWSGGEGQRLRLAGALALRDVLLRYAGVDCALEVLDEPTRHLSASGRNDLCDFLADRAKERQRQTWYTDHHTSDSAKFASVVTVTKDKEGSRIET